MLIREPLLHFLVLGVLVFVLYGYIGPDGPADDEIIVTRGQQEHLVTAFTRSWQRPPTQAEFDGIVNEWIREEIAYREALQMRLDNNDTIIRRRLRQKLEVLAGDIVSFEDPSTEVLQQYLDENQGTYTTEPVYTFQQVYFSEDKRRAAAMHDAEQALQMLNSESAEVNRKALGDMISLRQRYVDESESVLAATMGIEFADALRDLQVNKWQGPIRSGYGLHLIYIEEMSPGRALTLEEARREVNRDWSNEQRVRTIDKLYEQLRGNYTITVEPMAEASAGS